MENIWEMKIEAKEILGKIYFEIKDFIQRTDILPEMEIFLNGNYPPILSAIFLSIKSIIIKLSFRKTKYLKFNLYCLKMIV